MTDKETIRVLEEIKKHPSMQVYLPDEYEALDMAIEALELLEKLEKAYKSDYQIQDLIEVCAELWG